MRYEKGDFYEKKNFKNWFEKCVFKPINKKTLEFWQKNPKFHNTAKELGKGQSRP